MGHRTAYCSPGGGPNIQVLCLSEHVLCAASNHQGTSLLVPPSGTICCESGGRLSAGLSCPGV
jgi:hypothetical protein